MAVDVSAEEFGSIICSECLKGWDIINDGGMRVPSDLFASMN